MILSSNKFSVRRVNSFYSILIIEYDIFSLLEDGEY